MRPGLCVLVFTALVLGCSGNGTPSSSLTIPPTAPAAAPVAVVAASVVTAPRLYPCEDGRRLGWTGTGWRFLANAETPVLDGPEPTAAPAEMLRSCRLLDIIQANLALPIEPS
jgi:hypothetical protein